MVLLQGWGISESNEQLVYYYDPWSGGSYELCTYGQFCNGTYDWYPYVESVHIPY